MTIYKNLFRFFNFLTQFISMNKNVLTRIFFLNYENFVALRFRFKQYSWIFTRFYTQFTQPHNYIHTKLHESEENFNFKEKILFKKIFRIFFYFSHEFLFALLFVEAPSPMRCFSQLYEVIMSWCLVLYHL